MLEEYSERNLRSVFIYCREAHPGEHFPAHETFDQKLKYAREFRERFNVRRPILVDDLNGTAHRAFGMLPNMVYILNQANTALFKANWTDPQTIRLVVDYLYSVLDQRRSGLRLNPFYAELHGDRWVNDEVFFDGLQLAGQQAVDDFHHAREMWRRGEHLGSVRNPLLS